MSISLATLEFRTRLIPSFLCLDRGVCFATRDRPLENLVKTMTLARVSISMFLLALFVFIPTNLRAQSNLQDADKIQALQKQLDDMKAQMQKMQAQILELSSGANRATSVVTTTPSAAPTTTVTATAQEEGAAQAAELKVVPARKVSPATASYQTDSQDQIAAPRIDNAPLDPRYPGYFRLPGTQTLLRIGGYFKTDFIYDLKPPGNVDSFIPSTFPIPTLSTVNNTTISIRPTRLNLDFLIPVKSTSVRFLSRPTCLGPTQPRRV